MLERPMKNVGPDLLTRLLNEHGARLMLYAQQRCTTPEDVVQEAFLALVRQRPMPADPSAWLYRAVRNGAISASRSTSRRSRYERAAAEACPEWFTTTDGECLDVAAARAALEALPVELREAVVLRLWSDLSFEEIGKLTETSTSTAHRRYSEGLSALRERLNVRNSQ
jgi:RNA polymerase sigma factor (sigma-70 family)